jgi:hypothetical protein
VPDTKQACAILCHLPADAAAVIVAASLVDLRLEGTEPAYEVWRRRIQAHFVRENVFS